ncbi:MAG: putative adipose-regulatory protein-domain-containing protein [Benjaminiella poitrasii]|nr:MAG: putative adipose-regulatory protein-domain-containing protein [Benjaminiella poitrasii]
MLRSYSDIDDYSDQGLLNPDLQFVPSSQYNHEFYEEDLSLLPPLPDADDVDELKDQDESTPSIEWHPAIIVIARLIKNLILLPIFRVIFAPYAQRAFIQSLVIVIGVVWILLTSFTAYLTFYQRYIPKIAHVEPIYFQYHQADLPQGHIHFIDPQRQFVEMPLRNEQAYDISVQLHVPTSDINFDLGNFMLHVELQTTNGTLLVKSSRPAILRYQSYAQRVLHVLAKSIPLLIGWTEESQLIHVPLIENYIEKKATPITQAHVTLSTSKLQVYDAHISIVADFHGLRYYMYHRRIATAIAFIVLFTLVEIVFAIGAWRVFGRGLWNKLDEAFTMTDELVTMPANEEGNHPDQQYTMEEDNDDDNTYFTED